MLQLPELATHNAAMHITSLTITFVQTACVSPAGVCVLGKTGRMRGIRLTDTVYNSHANVLQAVELLSGIIK